MISDLLAQAPRLEAPDVDYWAITPLLIVLGAACVSVLVEAFLPRYQRWPAQVVLSIVTFGAAGVTLGVYAGSRSNEPLGVTTLANSLAIDRPTLFLWGTLLALGLGSILLIADRSVEPGGAFIASSAARAAVGGRAVATDAEERSYGMVGQAPTMQTEVFPFTLFALGGMMTFCAANDLLTMFIALEVLSLPLYLMCGLARRRRLL